MLHLSKNISENKVQLLNDLQNRKIIQIQMWWNSGPFLKDWTLPWQHHYSHYSVAEVMRQIPQSRGASRRPLLDTG